MGVYYMLLPPTYIYTKTLLEEKLNLLIVIIVNLVLVKDDILILERK
jgi:hypothetical protein